jgi:tetraacyldisaccharide 4'-kinase
MREIENIIETTAQLGATAVTTPKDAVRLPPALLGQVRVVGVRLVWDDAAAIEHLLGGIGGVSPRHNDPRS